MIIFGAGASVPFGIPGMVGFTAQYKKSFRDNKEVTNLLNVIEKAINHSGETVGISISFDLESLLSVLTDLSGTMNEKPISVPTASLLIREKLSIDEARRKYMNTASFALDKLREFIFNKCIQPIKKGKQEGNFRFLDYFFGPLMTVLNKTDLNNIQDPIKKIYSTNWDLCFKTWTDYVNIPINDGTDIDYQSFPVLNVGKFQRVQNGFNYIPLHGSLDLIKIDRSKGEGVYKDIFKVSDPIGYFENKPENIKDVFMIYPLEAIGYEESIKSPYLDMLYNFRLALESESVIFIIGYSLRDPTVGSIFEEVIASRIRKGDILPLAGNIQIRKEMARSAKLKIIVIDSNPNKIKGNLRKQSRYNLLSTFVPVKIKFPKINDQNFHEKMSQSIAELIDALKAIDYIGEASFNQLKGILSDKYSIYLDEIIKKDSYRNN